MTLKLMGKGKLFWFFLKNFNLFSNWKFSENNRGNLYFLEGALQGFWIWGTLRKENFSPTRNLVKRKRKEKQSSLLRFYWLKNFEEGSHPLLSPSLPRSPRLNFWKRWQIFSVFKIIEWKRESSSNSKSQKKKIFPSLKVVDKKKEFHKFELL